MLYLLLLINNISKASVKANTSTGEFSFLSMTAIRRISTSLILGIIVAKCYYQMQSSMNQTASVHATEDVCNIQCPGHKKEGMLLVLRTQNI